MARLHFFLPIPDIHSKLKNTSISHGYRTDHSTLILELNLLEAKHGKGFWKFNNSLLQDKEYINVVKQEICNTISQYKFQPLGPTVRISGRALHVGKLVVTCRCLVVYSAVCTGFLYL